MPRKFPGRLKPYEHLTPTGQLRRLGRMVQKALRSYPFEVLSSNLLNDGENATFDVRVREDGQNVRYLMRLHRPRKNAEVRVRSELDWIRALSIDTDISVPIPVPTRDGDHLQVITLEGVPTPRVAVLFEFMEGRYQSSYALSTIKSIGKLTARLHKHGLSWKPPESFERFRWDAEGLIGDNANWGCPLDVPDLEDEQYDVIEDVCDAIFEDLEATGTDAPHFGLIHADLHPYNLLHYKGHLNVIDFDDCGLGYLHYDIGVFFNAIRRRERFDAYFDAFCEAYSEILPLHGLDRHRLEMFMLIRRLAQLGWLAGRLDEPDTAEHLPYAVERTTEYARDYLDSLG